MYEGAVRLLHRILLPSELVQFVFDRVEAYKEVILPSKPARLESEMESLSLAGEASEDKVPIEFRILANVKALELVRLVLQHSPKCMISELGGRLLTELVITAINSDYASVQSAGLLCLALYGTLSRVRGPRIHLCVGVCLGL